MKRQTMLQKMAKSLARSSIDGLGAYLVVIQSQQKLVLLPLSHKVADCVKISGPAIIENPLTTVVLIPRTKVTINKVGSYVMELS